MTTPADPVAEVRALIREVGDLVLFRDDPGFGAHVHRLETALVAAWEAERARADRYEAALRRVLGQPGGVGAPVLQDIARAALPPPEEEGS